MDEITLERVRRTKVTFKAVVFNLTQLLQAARYLTRWVSAGTSRHHSVKFIVNAAALAESTVDIKQMLQEALETPSKPNRPATTPGAASSVKTQGLDMSKLPSPGAADQGQKRF